MKHADKDPTGTLENFSEMDTDSILFIACHDFLRVAKGQPIEMQVFEAWWFATAHVKVSEAPLRAQETIRRCIRRFPGIRSGDRQKRQALGLAALNQASLNPNFVMAIEKEVRLPIDDL
jgi:hypothetical protein